MTRLILVSILALLSLLVLFRAPTSFLWYVSILVTEFCWVFFLAICFLLVWNIGATDYKIAVTLIGLAAMIVYLLPLIQAFQAGQRLEKDFAQAFPQPSREAPSTPFRPLQMLTGIGAKQVQHETLTYDSVHRLSLDFYPAQQLGARPCVVVIHGGSWAGGNNSQLPELNSVLAKDGYHVASISYRLAPQFRYPAPLEDVRSAMNFLCAQAERLSIDTTAFTLLGRSAGGQIALSAAYTSGDGRIRGVVNFYGPADMVWGYQHPCNPLVLDSRKVMEDYLGGTLANMPQQYSRSSATETVGRHAPPTLMLYAENDPLVSPRHGNRLAEKLDKFGVRYVALYLPWATHAFDYSLNGPGGQLSTWAVRRFLAAVNGPR